MLLTDLITTISNTHEYFQRQAAQKVNTAMTLRNWFIGCYLLEYEQRGQDRATYGEHLYKEIAAQLLKQRLKGFSIRNLYLYKSFYEAYPQIVQTVSAQLQEQGLLDAPLLEKIQASVQKKTLPANLKPTDPFLLVSRLSFSHFVELLKADSAVKQLFYEIQAIKNNWGVRDLQRAIETSLYERTGLSSDKLGVIGQITGTQPLTPENVIKNPYVLEFLGLQESAAFNESDLEKAILEHLQAFLIELGRGFCFEARQKRITFDNEHYRIDLVFYHRLLKCHVLIDLKIGAFSHADAGQMNLYLNYYKENEMSEGDNPPIGIILCAHKNNALVRYATGGLPHAVFVSKYMVNLPNEAELTAFMQAEQQRVGFQ
jgi:predicted nuclease of restriction endonuclease-like (RecB) superfamily